MDCPTGYISYTNQTKAFKVLGHLKAKKNRPRGKRKKKVFPTLQPFLCSHCGEWHLGNKFYAHRN
jgi:hypothetical protein